MTEIEISKALALAIGWTEDLTDAEGFIDPDIRTVGEFRGEPEHVEVWFDGAWRTFDYRDPTVLWPIAERYNAFPLELRAGHWGLLYFGRAYSADTAAKAVALAVIGMAKRKT